MRKGLYPIIAGVLLAIFLLSRVFEDQINSLPAPFPYLVLAGAVIITLGAILLALWDTKVLGKKE